MSDKNGPYTTGEKPAAYTERQAVRADYKDETITKDDAAQFTFAEYRKVGTTKLSNEVLPVGTKVQTLEGEVACAEPSRLAIDVDGNVYVVGESHFRKSYEPAGLGKSGGEGRTRKGDDDAKA